MHIPVYLTTSRHRIYYFRWPLPKSKHSHQKIRDIKISLATRDFNEALQLSRLLAYLAQHLSIRMKNNNMRYDEMREVLKQHFTGLLERTKEHIAREGRLKDDKIAFYNETIQHIEDDNYVEFVMGSYEPTLHSIIDGYDLPIKEGTQEYQDFKNEYQRSRISYSQEVLDYDALLSPSFHHQPTFLKQITAPVCCLYFVLNGVCQCHFGYVTSHTQTQGQPAVTARIVKDNIRQP